MFDQEQSEQAAIADSDQEVTELCRQAAAETDPARMRTLVERIFEILETRCISQLVGPLAAD